MIVADYSSGRGHVNGMPARETGFALANSVQDVRKTGYGKAFRRRMHQGLGKGRFRGKFRASQRLQRRGVTQKFRRQQR